MNVRRHHRASRSGCTISASGAEKRERVADLLRTVGLLPDARGPLSARVLRRPAPAHRHRPGARGRSQADHRRRAGFRARRVDPGADHQPARGSEGPLRPHARHRRARSRRHPAHERPGGRHVSGRDRRVVATRMRCSTTRCIPTRRRLLAAIPVPSPATASRRRCCRATCRARPLRRPAAASTPAAPMHARCCKEQHPLWKQRPTDGRSPAISGAKSRERALVPSARRPRARRSPSAWRSTELGANGRISPSRRAPELRGRYPEEDWRTTK